MNEAAKKTPEEAQPALFSRITGLLPALFRLYERFCRRLAGEYVYNVGFFLSTWFCGPVGLYIWESARGGRLRRFIRGLAAWLILALGLFVFFAGFGWLLALLTLLPGRPFRWIVRKLRLTRPWKAPEIPKDLTFKLEALDIVSLLFIAFIFLALVANRDDIVRAHDMVSDSDPAYHMAVARQILELGHVPRWDRWEYAPFGRPHLYPPLLHHLIAFFAGSPDDVVFGFNTLQILLLPLALFSAWYFTRWLFGPALGFAAVIFASMEGAFVLSQGMVLPAAIVTALLPMILMAFLTRRTTALVVLLTISFYTHLGMPFLVMLGLLVLAVKYREYFPEFRKAAAFSGFFYVPWLFRLLRYHSWLGTSSGMMGPAKNVVEVVLRGLLQLQMLNLVLLLLALWAWRRDKDERLGVVKGVLIGFLPMLFSYGGRYFMHTWPLWAILVARNVEGWLERARAKAAEGDEKGQRSLRRRILTLVFVAFLPLPIVTVGMPGNPGLGIFPWPTAADTAVIVAFWRTEPDEDFARMADFIKATMKPGRIPDRPPPPDKRDGDTYVKYLAGEEYAALRSGIVHIGRERFGSIYFGDWISTATGCRVDTGGWGPEVRRPLMKEEVERARADDAMCLFAFRRKHGGFKDEEVETLTGLHGLEWTRRFGKHYLVGGRGIPPAGGEAADLF